MYIINTVPEKSKGFMGFRRFIKNIVKIAGITIFRAMFYHDMPGFCKDCKNV